MKRFLIIKIPKKVFIGFTLLLLAIIIICLLFINIGHKKTLQISNNLSSEEDKEELIRENNMLKGIIDGILPTEEKVLYENPYRLYGDQTITIPTSSLEDVLKKGKDIQFSVSYKVPEYARPIYYPRWPQAYYRGWINLVPKVVEARHRLFIFPLGLSSSYDFTGSLGFTGSPHVNAHRNINFLIYHFEVEDIKQFGHQIALVGRPKRTGVEVIAVNKDYLFPVDEGVGDFLIQLSTPSGYEIDFIYEKNIMKYDYLMREIEKHTVQLEPTLSIANEISLEELKEENKLLREKVSLYIPIQVEETITEKECRQWPTSFYVGNIVDIETAIEQGKEIEYNKHYQSEIYTRPIYHPEWKINAQNGWAYIPSKICENLHSLFSLPSNSGEQLELLGKLGFLESYTPIPKDRVGILIYNFNIQKVIKYNNQIVISGIPSRIGAEIISIDTILLVNKKDYLVQLVTPDGNEVDYDILITE